MNWSRWFRCESSFELLLVPSQPGVFALAEEVVQAAGPQARCYVRYAIAPSIADRRAAATALKNWLSTQREVASQIFEQRAFEQKTFEQRPAVAAEPTVAVSFGGAGEVRTERRAARTQHESGALEMKTVAERAVDRVTHGIKLGKAVSAGS